MTLAQFRAELHIAQKELAEVCRKHGVEVAHLNTLLYQHLPALYGALLRGERIEHD